MFAQTQMTAMNFGFPDVCITPISIALAVVPMPIPYLNIGVNSTSFPEIFNQFIMCMPAHNLLTMTPMSLGDTPGVLLGVWSKMFMGSSRHMFGSFKVFKRIMPATKMLDITGQNCWGMTINALGMAITPCQVKVMYFC